MEGRSHLSSHLNGAVNGDARLVHPKKPGGSENVKHLFGSLQIDFSSNSISTTTHIRGDSFTQQNCQSNASNSKQTIAQV